jgi:hypothetical protein
MKLEELEKALDLQQRAYRLLIWIGREQPTLLDVNALSSSAACALWVKRHWNVFPAEHRPELSEIDAFGKMLSSYLNTSFHLQGEAGALRLARGRAFKNGQSRKYGQRRDAQTAAELSKLALTYLAQDEGLQLTEESITAILNDEALSAAVGLWAYGCELVRRSQFASQGAAVHHLWTELDEKKRRRLTAEEIWKARSILAAELKRRGRK